MRLARRFARCALSAGPPPDVMSRRKFTGAFARPAKRRGGRPWALSASARAHRCCARLGAGRGWGWGGRPRKGNARKAPVGICGAVSLALGGGRGVGPRPAPLPPMAAAGRCVCRQRATTRRKDAVVPPLLSKFRCVWGWGLVWPKGAIGFAGSLLFACFWRSCLRGRRRFVRQSGALGAHRCFASTERKEVGCAFRFGTSQCYRIAGNFRAISL